MKKLIESTEEFYENIQELIQDFYDYPTEEMPRGPITYDRPRRFIIKEILEKNKEQS